MHPYLTAQLASDRRREMLAHAAQQRQARRPVAFRRTERAANQAAAHTPGGPPRPRGIRGPGPARAVIAADAPPAPPDTMIGVAGTAAKIPAAQAQARMAPRSGSTREYLWPAT